MNPSVHYVGAGRVAPEGDHARCEALWEQIIEQHRHVYGDGSAYNFAACNAHGIRMLGRGWDRSSAANGQQAGVDYNPGSRALLALMGTDDEPTPAMARAIADFANEAFARGYERPLRGHSEYVATGCPGDALRAVIARFNAGEDGSEDVLTDDDKKLIGQWMQDQRNVTLDVLIGHHDVTQRGVLASWERDTRTVIVAALAKLPAAAVADPKLLADAVVAGLGAETARLVADELSNRLRT